jgi:hypothetical protein
MIQNGPACELWLVSRKTGNSAHISLPSRRVPHMGLGQGKCASHGLRRPVHSTPAIHLKRTAACSSQMNKTQLVPHSHNPNAHNLSFASLFSSASTCRTPASPATSRRARWPGPRRKRLCHHEPPCQRERPSMGGHATVEWLLDGALWCAQSAMT